MSLIPKPGASLFGFLCRSRPPAQEGATAGLGRREHRTEARRQREGGRSGTVGQCEQP